MTSRELVYETLEFQNKKGPVPRHLWSLPWAHANLPGVTEELRRRFPDDITSPEFVLAEPTIEKGSSYTSGEYTDPWGCVFKNIQSGIIGEVKEPLIPVDDFNWDGAGNIHIPEELLTFDIDDVNRFCKNSEKFIMSGFCARPFEQLQFIRGTENLYIDLLEIPPKMAEFMKRMHDFNCRAMEKWAKTDVDTLNFMDDWGSQRSLLINPALWNEIFAPMYRDFIDIAHTAGKKIFMHSDGYILEIIPALIKMGLDALNSQIFCMGIEALSEYKGKITFWGEIDRQQLIPYGSAQDIENTVRSVYNTLWENGGCIAQFELGPGAKAENAFRIMEVWDEIGS